MIILYRGVGETKVVPSGFSWTTFFFGLFPALSRGDFFHAFLMFGTACLTLGLSALVWPFVYNGLYFNRLMNQGWTQRQPQGGQGSNDTEEEKASSRPAYHEPEYKPREVDVYSPQYERLFGPVTGGGEYTKPQSPSPAVHRDQKVLEVSAPAQPIKSFGRKGLS